MQNVSGQILLMSEDNIGSSDILSKNFVILSVSPEGGGGCNPPYGSTSHTTPCVCVCV